MSAFASLEKKLDELFVKNAPALPENGKKALVKYLPWINLVFGILALLAAISVWRWVNIADSAVDYVNTYSSMYGGATISHGWSLWLWLGLIVLIIEAVLYLMAFPATRKRQKYGWDLMFYAALVNIVYAIVIAFSAYGNIGGMIFNLLGTVVGLYLLFQIRTLYIKHGKKEA